ncbi:MAG: polyhydroxyalkanoate depolymerase [Proteobacteria bacterium]|nr:polyhydroxyalkanoate depolymerase [Pseudomonadota bacterium]
MLPLLYTLYEWQKVGFLPTHIVAQSTKNVTGLLGQKNPFIDWLYASSSLLSRSTMSFKKPDFNITSIEGVKVEEKIIIDKTFGNLLHFEKIYDEEQKEQRPCVLVVAPMSGHFSTLVRDTIETLLQDMDVFVTDWKDVKHISLEKGKFSLNMYISYIIEFIEFLRKYDSLHVMAICQPAVPVLGAVSLLSENANQFSPDSMILMGGPIDTRINPGKVNLFSNEHDENFIESLMVSMVPAQYEGRGRRVLPGFTMLSGFMALNPDRHQEALKKFYQHLVVGDMESAEKHEIFYNEYRSVMDLDAAYFLDTYKAVFRDYSLPNGTFAYGDYVANPKSIKNTALLTIEGELDDISPVGQTKAAHDLCIHIPAHKKHHHLQLGVGHYGIFNGRRWRTEIYPVIKRFIYEKGKK